MTAQAMMRALARAVFPAALAAVALWFFGLAWPFAVAAGVIVIAAVLAIGSQGESTAPQYVTVRADPRPGTRSDFSQTAWSLREWRGSIGDPGIKRLRTFARRRLARHGWDLDDPAAAPMIRAALGERAWTVLAGGSRIRTADIEHCIERLEALDPTGAHTA